MSKLSTIITIVIIIASYVIHLLFLFSESQGHPAAIKFPPLSFEDTISSSDIGDTSSDEAAAPPKSATSVSKETSRSTGEDGTPAKMHKKKKKIVADKHNETPQANSHQLVNKIKEEVLSPPHNSQANIESASPTRRKKKKSSEVNNNFVIKTEKTSDANDVLSKSPRKKRQREESLDNFKSPVIKSLKKKKRKA